MSRPLLLSRDQAEWLVDILEKHADAHRELNLDELAAELRELFGMIPHED